MSWGNSMLLYWLIPPLLIAGCGGIGGGSQPKPGPCSLTVGGGVAGNVTCSGEIVTYVSTDNTSLFSLGGGSVAGTTAALETSTISWNGMPTPNVYSPPAVNSADGSVSQTVNSKMHAWIARYSPMPPANEPNVGSYQLDLKSVAMLSATGGADYFAHGTVTLTLIDQDPTPLPQVVVTADF